MMYLHKIYALSLLFTLWGVFAFFTSCKKASDYDYPLFLEEAIDLFYVENKNDTVLRLLSPDSFIEQPGAVQDVITIFRAGALAESGEVDSALMLLQNVRAQLLSPRALYYYKSIQGLIFFRLNQHQQAYRILTPLISEPSYDQRSLALNERLMARVMSFYENYELSIRLFLNSIQNFEEAGLEKSAAITKKFMASIYSELEAYDQAVRLINEAEETFMAHNDTEELYYLYIVAIKLYVEQELPELAQEYVQKAMGTIGVNDAQKRSSIYTFMGRIETLRGNHARAVQMFTKVAEIDEPYFGWKRGEARAHLHLAKLYNDLGAHESAISNAQRALQIIRDDGLHLLKHDAFKELSYAYLQKAPSKASIYMDSSLIHLKKYHDASTKGIVEFLSTRFELEDTVDKLYRLQEQQRRNHLINFMVVVLVSAGVAIGFIVYRMKQRENNILSELVKKNPVQMKTDQKMGELIHKQYAIENNQPNQPLTNEQKIQMLYHELIHWLEKEKHYLKSDLDLNTVSRELGTNRSYLSKAINSQGTRFTELVNYYRIQEVLAIFEDENDERNSFTLQEIAAESGFHTKSVFFEAFRRETGMTPNQFKEHLKFSKLTNK